MAIVDLGTRQIDTTNIQYVFDGFPYLRTQAYSLGCSLIGSNWDLYFSKLEVRFRLLLNSGIQIDAPERVTLNIDTDLQILYFAASPLFSDDGIVVPIVTRKSNYTVGQEILPLSVNLLYDDALSVPTWRG